MAQIPVGHPHAIDYCRGRRAVNFVPSSGDEMTDSSPL
jgi:hypothetical protein